MIVKMFVKELLKKTDMLVLVNEFAVMKYVGKVYNN